MAIRIPNARGAAVDQLTRLWRQHPRLPLNEAEAQIRDHYPIWQLTLEGYVFAANRLALWLWGASGDGMELRPETVLGRQVFDLIVRNRSRIPIEKNSEFFTRKCQAYKNTSSPDDDTPFALFMKSGPALRSIYEHADPTELENVWTYILRILEPTERLPARLREFTTTVHAVARDGEPYGYVARYFPLGSTREVVARYYQLSGAADQSTPYVLYSNIERLAQAGRRHQAAPGGRLGVGAADSRPEPPVVLYTCATAESQEAVQTLEDAGVEFRVVASGRRRRPRAEFGGLVFQGSEGIRDLVRGLQAMEAAFFESLDPNRPSRRDRRPSSPSQAHLTRQ